MAHWAPKFLPRTTKDNTEFHAAIAGAVAGAYHARAVAEQYGVPVILHTDHCAKYLGVSMFLRLRSSFPINKITSSQ